MSLFAEYPGNYWQNINTDQLDIVRQDQGFLIFQGTKPLLTPRGNEVILGTERVAHLIITDLMHNGGMRGHGISAPWLYGFQKDVFEPDGDPFKGEWQKLLSSDPFVAVKTTGKINVPSFGPDEDLFSFAILTLSSLVRAINEFVNSTMREIIVQDSDINPFLELLRFSYDRLSIEKKVVVQALSGLHHSGIVLPVVLLNGTISPLEYAKGLVALKMQEERRIPELLLDLAHALDYLQCLEQKPDAGRQAGSIIKEGENEVIEFKSTLRWDIRASKTNQAIERACLKAIAAFLNSAGGTLLIGVADDGSIVGIEKDNFANDDKFLLHLWTLIRTCLGRDVCLYIRTTLDKTGNGTMCMVQCGKSSRPVFLRQPGFDEEFFIRVGPSSNAMDISEALNYIADHFPPG